MRQLFSEISKKTKGRGLYDITPEVKSWIQNESLLNGLLTMNILHTSASLMVNENYDPDVLIDMENFFSRLVVDGDPHFIHTTEGQDDMPAHIRTALTQTQLSVPIQQGQIKLGTWQGLFVFEHRYHDFSRKIALHFIGD
ncbi:MAG: secondary thiamine-phosphate synthase enzyme YjbQ [Methylophilaceae bacterium]|jgi:secondary thiamine-phosphate synthase enzyme